MPTLVLTVIGPDRPGLVEALSDAITRHDASWQTSSMAQLAGQFAGIVQVDVGEGAADALAADLVNLQAKGLAVTVTPAEGDAAGAELPHAFELELVGLDRPGIVRDLARALAARAINVAQLDTATESAAMSGERLFRAHATLHAPADADADELEDALDHLAEELDLDLSFGAAAATAPPEGR
ncbi:MAG: ACT domain-containing protein [Planctomycetota bacterium]